MKQAMRKAGAVATSTIMLGTMAAGSAYAVANDAPSWETSSEAAERTDESSAVRSVIRSEYVAGSFSFDQTSVSSTKAIAQAMTKASKHLCGSSFAESSAHEEAQRASLDEWEIAIKGDVEQEMTATLGDLAEKSTSSITMGCSCAGNPADGQASVNAEVTGVALKTILDEASPLETANTITFTSSDGYEVSLPLRYVMQRYCLLAFDVNGEPLADSMGGTNQVWLGSTSAKYFAKDIVCIEIESRENPVPAPGDEDADRQGANLPNIGVVSGCVA